MCHSFELFLVEKIYTFNFKSHTHTHDTTIDGQQKVLDNLNILQIFTPKGYINVIRILKLSQKRFRVCFKLNLFTYLFANNHGIFEAKNFSRRFAFKFLRHKCVCPNFRSAGVFFPTLHDLIQLLASIFGHLNLHILSENCVAALAILNQKFIQSKHLTFHPSICSGYLHFFE